MQPVFFRLINILFLTSILIANINCAEIIADQDIPDIQLILTPETLPASPRRAATQPSESPGPVLPSACPFEEIEGHKVPCDSISISSRSCSTGTKLTSSSMAENPTNAASSMPATEKEKNDGSDHASLQQPAFPLPHKFYRLSIETNVANPASPYTLSQASALADQLIRELTLTSGSTPESYELDFVEKVGSMSYTTLEILTKWPTGRDLTIKSTNANGAFYKSQDASTVSIYLQVPFAPLTMSSQDNSLCGGQLYNASP